jgi:hypothetical protein
MPNDDTYSRYEEAMLGCQQRIIVAQNRQIKLMERILQRLGGTLASLTPTEMQIKDELYAFDNSTDAEMRASK